MRAVLALDDDRLARAIDPTGLEAPSLDDALRAKASRADSSEVFLVATGFRGR